MNIMQTFRRISQQMKWWNDSFVSQYHQYILIKKLYLQNGLKIEGGGACPEQYDIFKDNIQVAYYRLRHGEFTVSIPDAEGELIFIDYPNGDGIFDSDERLLYMARAMRKLLLKLK